MSELRFLRLDEAGRAVFSHSGNDSRMREGDLVTLRQAEDDDETSASLFREEQGDIWLSAENGFKAALFEPPDGWFIDEAFLDLSSHYLMAFDRIPASAIGQERILPLLMSWSALGLDVRSRTHKLEKPYRSTRAILEFARDFYRSRLPDDDEPLNLPAPEWLETLEPGLPPVIQPGGAGQDQLRRLEADLRALRSGGLPPEHILVLLAGRTLSADAAIQHLNTRLGSQSATSMRDDHAPIGSIGVAHLMAATGLERPVVFLLGCDDLFAAEANPLLTDEERAEQVHDHTRQIYVGITRAMERVVIYTDRLPMLFKTSRNHACSASELCS